METVSLACQIIVAFSVLYVWVFRFDNIVIECTFFDESDLRLAVERKHMHWLQLKPIIRNNPNINFYLIHISAKYTDKNKLLEEVNEDLSNVFLL